MIPYPRYKIRKDDQVMVVRGKERGKTGRVTRVLPERGTIIIEKLNIVKRHQRPSQKHRHGGIIEKEAPINISNVMLICDKCKKQVRMGRKTLEDGKKARYCKKCGEVLDR
jgi:large subunit ribosomal protein L24